MRVKTAPYDLPELGEELRDVVRAGRVAAASARRARERLPARRGTRRARPPSCSAFRELIPEYRHGDVLRVILSRAARSARRAAHFDLEAPKAPQSGGVLVPQAPARVPAGGVGGRLPPPLHARHAGADRGVRAACATRSARRRCCTATRESSASPGRTTRILTSPPYPGLIDYHEQHRYAYELLELDDRREREIGAAASGTSLASLEAYRDGHRGRPRAAAVALRPDAPVLVVVNDRRDLYPEILARAGLHLEARLRRHVNRRTGRRAGEYFEDVLVARAS